MRDFWTNALTKGFQVEPEIEKSFEVQNFSAAPWVKFGDARHAPIQLHTSNQQSKSPSQMDTVVSYK